MGHPRDSFWYLLSFNALNNSNCQCWTETCKANVYAWRASVKCWARLIKPILLLLYSRPILLVLLPYSNTILNWVPHFLGQEPGIHFFKTEITIANQWAGFCIIGTSIMRELSKLCKCCTSLAQTVITNRPYLKYI